MIKNGLPNGKGVNIDLNGYKYVGFFTNGKKHGKGVEEFSNNMKYDGEFIEGFY